MSEAGAPSLPGRRPDGWLPLGDLLRERARSRGEAMAAICGDLQLTHAEVDRRVDAAGAVLMAHGVGAGDRVLWLGQNCHRVLELLMACARLGAALVPANWRQTPDELAWAIDDLQPRLVVWQHDGLARVVELTRELVTSPVEWLCHDDGDDGYEGRLAAAGSGRDGMDERPAVDARSPVFGIYTGAFGGKPSCALIDHAAITAQSLVVAAVHEIDHETVFLNSGPLFHVGTAMSTLATFVMGGTNVFIPTADAAAICRAIVAHRVTRAFVVEPTRGKIVEFVEREGHDLRTLRGWPGPPAWNAIVTPDTSTWGRDVGGYGQTEAMGHVSFRGLAPGATGQHGRPTPIVELEVLDDAGLPATPGELGELAVRGPQVMVGYHGRADENAARRTPPRWHRTADLGRREADGSLTFVGPKGRMLKSGVENVYPAEVEACIATHPGVSACAVIGEPDPAWVQNVVAVVVRTSGHLDEAAIIEHCRARIASYKKPKRVVFVDELPRDGAFVDYARLDAQYGGGGYPGGATRAVRG